MLYSINQYASIYARFVILLLFSDVITGCKTILACRSLDRGTHAAHDIIQLAGVNPDNVKVMKLDLGSLQSVRDFVANFIKGYR